jgi:hypothetical protein
VVLLPQRQRRPHSAAAALAVAAPATEPARLQGVCLHAAGVPSVPGCLSRAVGDAPDAAHAAASQLHAIHRDGSSSSRQACAAGCWEGGVCTPQPVLPSGNDGRQCKHPAAANATGPGVTLLLHWAGGAVAKKKPLCTSTAAAASCCAPAPQPAANA